MAMQLKKDLQFKDYIIIFLRHKYQILITVICFMLPTWYFISQKPGTYNAYSQLAMDEGEQNIFILSPQRILKLWDIIPVFLREGPFNRNY